VNVSVNIPMLIRVQFSVFFYFSETEITEALTDKRRDRAMPIEIAGRRRFLLGREAARDRLVTRCSDRHFAQIGILTIDANSTASPANAPGSCSWFIGMCLLTRARVWLNRSELPGGKRRFDFSV
jgi:hypothetical protein